MPTTTAPPEPQTAPAARPPHRRSPVQVVREAGRAAAQAWRDARHPAAAVSGEQTTPAAPAAQATPAPPAAPPTPAVPRGTGAPQHPGAPVPRPPRTPVPRPKTISQAEVAQWTAPLRGNPAQTALARQYLWNVQSARRGPNRHLDEILDRIDTGIAAAAIDSFVGAKAGPPARRAAAAALASELARGLVEDGKLDTWIDPSDNTLDDSLRPSSIAEQDRANLDAVVAGKESTPRQPQPRSVRSHSRRELQAEVEALARRCVDEGKLQSPAAALTLAIRAGDNAKAERVAATVMGDEFLAPEVDRVLGKGAAVLAKRAFSRAVLADIGWRMVDNDTLVHAQANETRSSQIYSGAMKDLFSHVERGAEAAQPGPAPSLQP